MTTHPRELIRTFMKQKSETKKPKNPTLMKPQKKQHAIQSGTMALGGRRIESLPATQKYHNPVYNQKKLRSLSWLNKNGAKGVERQQSHFDSSEEEGCEPVSTAGNKEAR